VAPSACGVAVQRQVVGGERDVVGEQEPEARRLCGADAARLEVPQDPVVDEHELGLFLQGALEEGPLRGDAGEDGRRVLRAGDLEAVRAEVGVAGGLEQLVEERDDLGGACGRGGHGARQRTIARPLWNTG
jgi:hypothetical protein